MRIIVVYIIIGVYCNVAQAQTTVYPNKIKSVSSVGPLMSYLNDSTTNLAFTNMLDSILRKKRNWALPKNAILQFTPLTKNPDINSSNVFPALNLFFIEFNVNDFKRNANIGIEDSAKLKGLLCGLRLVVQIQNNEKELLFENAIDIYVKQGISNGIGIPIANLHFTQRGLSETLKLSCAILFDSTTTNESIELKIGGAFVGEDFILAKTNGFPRTQVSTSKGISKYNVNGELQLISWGEQLYREVILKGKNKSILAEDLIKAFENNNNKAESKPIILIQEGRDIVADKNFTLQIAANIGGDPNGFYIRPIVDIIYGDFHVLLNDKDTVALFQIETNSVDSTRKLFNNQVTNGFDSNSSTFINNQEKAIPLKFNYIVKGKINLDKFEIKISGDGILREFYLNNELICVANGNKAPERFVVLNNSISPEILNALFIIGFNSFFQ